MKHNAIIATLALLGASVFQANAQSVVTDSLGFDKAMATTPATVLQGQVSGLRITPIDGNVNGAVNTLIRGVNSLRSDSQPLWIVDGVVINSNLNQNKDAFFQYGEKSFTAPLNALSFLNEYDIESIEVLKDLSATTIYGSKGANGVIIINTRIPKEEGFNATWNSNVGIATPDQDLDGCRNAISHNHYVNMAGSAGQGRYVVSAYYRQLQGILNGNDGTYGGLRATFDTKANSVVWFGMNTTVTLGEMNSVAGTSYFGQPSLTMGLRNNGFFPGDSAEGWAADYDDNAVDRRVTNSMYLTLNFTPWLSLKTTFGVDYQNHNRYIWYGNGTSFGLENNGAASILGNSIFKYNANSVLSINRYFTNDHHLIIKAGIDASGDWTKFNTMNGTDYFTPVLRTRGLSLAASKAILHKYDHEYFTWGGFGELSYSFKNIAGFNAVLRGDNTPKYDDSDFVIYKGADVFFDLRNAFIPDSDIISTLKVKAGYGEAGREMYVPYGLYDEFISAEYPEVSSELQMFYEGINRVKSAEFSASIDFGFLSDRITGSFGYYDKMTNDAFNSYCFGEQVGKHYWKFKPRKDSFSLNSLIANRGFEGNLNLDILKSKNLGWTVYGNAAYNVNQMLKVSTGDVLGRKVGENVLVNANVVGFPVGTLYGYKVDETGAYIDITADGKINEYDKDIIGNPNPKIFGGLGTTFRVFGFTLDALATGAFGFDILNLNDLLFNEAAPYQISETYVEKGDYIRLSRVSLGYELKLGKKSPVKSIKLSASALNLLTFTSYSGWNPEVNCFGTTYLSSGVDYGSYPTSRSFVFGVNLNF